MDYNKIYNSIILKRKKEIPIGYSENHHIVPKSMGGSNSKNNLVRLTAREHFLAHWLLYKIHKNYKMACAWRFLCRNNDRSKRYTSLSYENARKALSIETSKRQRGIDNHMFGKKLSKEHMEILSSLHTGVPKPEEQKQKMRESSPKNKRVLCVNTGVIYTSASEARRQTGGSRHIESVCLGKRKTSGGYSWKYVN